MLEFHTNKQKQFDIQYQNSLNSILPYISRHKPLNTTSRILEVGCAEAGILKTFAEAGCQCTGIEISASRVETAKEKLAAFLDNIEFIVSDIYAIDPDQRFPEKFDVVILKDVLEHIPQQEKLIAHLGRFLKADGVIHLSFPSWYMPFGGHQQICFNKTLAKLPYVHLLPIPIYRWMLRHFNKHEAQNQNLLEVWETRISIHRFEKILRQNGFEKAFRDFYLVPPIYQYKFGMKTRRLPNWLGRIPFIREFFITSAYYLIHPGK